MDDKVYLIYSGSEPVTDLTNGIRDADAAKQLAADLSTKQSGETITVESRTRSQGGTEVRSPLARFRDGEEIPLNWRVDFFGYLLDYDHARLSAASIFYLEGKSEIGPSGEIRTGYARNVVSVEADDGHDAIAKVQDALGPKATECSEWNSTPARGPARKSNRPQGTAQGAAGQSLV